MESSRTRSINQKMSSTGSLVLLYPSLHKKDTKTSNGELFILMTEDGTLACQVNKKDEKDWQNFILLGLDETIVLQTQLRHEQ